MRAAAGVLSVLLAATALHAQVFRSGTEAVRIDVLVMDGRTPVTGLSAADFEVRDSGVLQRIDSMTLGDTPLSILLALDTSYSMHGRPLLDLKEAAGAVIDLLTPADRAAIITFSQALTLRAPWTSDRAALKASFANVEARGSTSLHDAAYTALTIRDEVPARALVLIFSDGNDTVSWLPGQAILDSARRSEAVVYAVGLKPRDDQARTGHLLDFRSGLQPVKPRVTGATLFEELLPELAHDTGGKYFDAERSGKLREAFVHIVTEFRTRYLLTYSPQGVDKGGWHPIEVKLKGKRGRIAARRGYLR
jgi:Ca-activated chloride channel homolog